MENKIDTYKDILRSAVSRDQTVIIQKEREAIFKEINGEINTKRILKTVNRFTELESFKKMIDISTMDDFLESRSIKRRVTLTEMTRTYNSSAKILVNQMLFFPKNITSPTGEQYKVHICFNVMYQSTPTVIKSEIIEETYGGNINSVEYMNHMINRTFPLLQIVYKGISLAGIESTSRDAISIDIIPPTEPNKIPNTDEDDTEILELMEKFNSVICGLHGKASEEASTNSTIYKSIVENDIINGESNFLENIILKLENLIKFSNVTIIDSNSVEKIKSSTLFDDSFIERNDDYINSVIYYFSHNEATKDSVTKKEGGDQFVF